MSLRILRAIGLGVLALLLVMLPGAMWSVLLVVNLLKTPNIPWSVLAMAGLLWTYWRYLDGRWPPHSTSAARHQLLRMNPVSPSVFALAVVSGIFGIVALAGLWILLLEMTKVSARALPDLSKYPLFTVVTVIGMACLVSSLPEEAAFRGYFQGFLERRLPDAVAVIISALVIAPAHSLTQGFLWPVLLFYFLVDSMLGTMAYLTKSILPGIVVHFTGLLIFFTLIWPYDAGRAMLRNAGAKDWFWIHVFQTIVCAVIAVIGFAQLARQPVGEKNETPNRVISRFSVLESAATPKNHAMK